MDDTDTPTTPKVPTSAASQAELLASARRKSMTPEPDPGAGTIVRCPRCRGKQRWEDMTKHIVMKEGDSAFRHCARDVCMSIFSLQEGEDARALHSGMPQPDSPQDGPGPELGPEDGCPEKEPYETPSLTEINIGAADALIAHHAKELALKLIRVADVVVDDEIARANSGGETRGLLDAIKYSLDLAGQADMLGDKAILRVPSIPVKYSDCEHCCYLPDGDGPPCVRCNRDVSRSMT